MRRVTALVLWGCACACSPAPADLGALPAWTFDPQMVFPVAGSLVRPEDGVALPDGTIVVADQAHGLRAIRPDGSSRPFGRFESAGYMHEPPSRPAASNSVSLEPDGAHLLVADVLTGAIYRVNVATEDAERIYAHAFGVNTAVRDRTGALWFTQSAENVPGPESEALLFTALDRAEPDGALFRIPPAADGAPLEPAARVLDGLYFANGLAIDDEAGHLYLAETTRDRVLGFHLGAATGELSDRRVVVDIGEPDNLEIDDAGLLWVVSPLRSEVVVVEPRREEVRSVFRSGSPAKDRIVAEWQRRGQAGEPRLDVVTPDLWLPLPGLITGVILTPGSGPVYLTGLGNALVRLPR